MKKNVLFSYLMKELFLFFIVAFLFFFLIFFVNQILLMAEDILKKRVPLFDVTKLIIYSLPFVIAQAAPFATLVGFLMCIGRLVSDNEILIVRASGLSFTILLAPVLVLGLLISIVSFAVNDYLLPLGTISYNDLYRKIILSNPGLELESNSIKRTNDSILIIGDVHERDVSDLLMFDTDSQNNQRITVAAETTILESKDRTVFMQLNMIDPEIMQFDKKSPSTYTHMKSEKAIMNLFANSFLSSSSSSTNPREMTSYDLKKVIIKKRIESEGERTFQLNLYEMEYYKKFSLPFGSLFFSLLAFPLALMFGKANGQTIGLIIGILISVLYWSLIIMGQNFGIRNNINGFYIMWLPNTIIAIFGIIFLLKLVKK